MTTRYCCKYCGSTSDLSAWLPEKYAADNYRPGSLSLDELEDFCGRCVTRFRVSHDPNIKRRPRPPWLRCS